MSLVIYVSKKTVIITKFQVEFPFIAPPENLTKAATGAYKLLRKSGVLQAESSRDEREEVITLLRHYGFALYEAIIPSQFKSQIYESGGLFVYSLDHEIINIPWELLYDGSSFLSLTQGVIRINNSSIKLPAIPSNSHRHSLNISLNSFTPLQLLPSGNRFISLVEELISENIGKSCLVDFKVNGNASKKSILDNLNNNPDIFFFSGYDSANGWVLQDTLDDSEDSWFQQELTPILRNAVEKGLKIVILQTSSFLKESDPLTNYFNLGIPYIISIHGRVSRHRIKQYFQTFLLSLMREQNTLRAHRQAINNIQSNLPLSWDWSWIQLHVNKNLLEIPTTSPLPSYKFKQNLKESKKISRLKGNSILNYRRFCGNFKILEELTDRLLNSSLDEVIHLQTKEGYLLEEYFQEFLRRLMSDYTFSLSALYYQRWGFKKGQHERLPSSKYAKLFPFLLEDEEIEDCFNQNVVEFLTDNNETPDFRFMCIYTPPERLDQNFDNWLRTKQKEGWKILFISDKSSVTKLKIHTISTDRIDLYQITDSFEDALPEQWIDCLDNRLPRQFWNLTLLKIVRNFQAQKIINHFCEKKKPDFLWKEAFDAIVSSLSSQKFKIFITLYLLRVRCPKEHLANLLSIKNIEKDLWYLHHLHLIDADLTFSCFWIPIHLHSQVEKYQLVSEKHLREIGQELLQSQIASYAENKAPFQHIICGFQYCIQELTRLGIIEIPLQRNLQIGKKLSRTAPVSSFLINMNIRNNLELALLAQRGHIIQKTLFSILAILENNPQEYKAIHLCEWLLKTEKQQRNWANVSEIQIKLATIYAKSNKKEKAIGLISSAIQLNNDIKNYSSKFKNLITIALLLLDLGEFDKLGKLLGTSDFDPKLLNKEDMSKLWLIDGHMLYYDRKFNEAEKSLTKTVTAPIQVISDNLMAKTHSYLAEIYHSRNATALYAKSLDSASMFFEQVGNTQKAFEAHNDLCELYLSSEDSTKAIKHLEWLLDYSKQSGDKRRVKEIADQLGGLYYKAGDQLKSTDYYSIAQGV